jgi:hypothetical protein
LRITLPAGHGTIVPVNTQRYQWKKKRKTIPNSQLTNSEYGNLGPFSE